ncbi:unnamed protein product [Parnassius apollo]|uniref:(apollo) hypothetical protein n=1 Tax=Parnassius apollo TaxID=110799 RepID=A0A8S3Y5G8_PARAO|nr:unnamed protein product [Parnassius apollo]
MPILDISFEISNLELRLIPNASAGTKGRFLLDTMALCDLKQYNSSKNQNDRLLDLVLSTMDELRVKEVEPLLKLDGHHPSIEINLNYTNNKPNFVKFNRKLLKPNYHKSNFEKIKDHLRKVNWHELLNELDPDSAVDAMYKELNSAILLFAPFKNLILTNTHTGLTFL